jgi:isopenicillin-N N-acyltransferase-like protein
MNELLDARHGTLTRTSATEVLVDHRGFPNSICRHESDEHPEVERGSSVASWVIDLTDGTVSLAAGPPCSNNYVTFVPAFSKAAAAA